MRITFAIIFAVIFGLIGARFAGWAATALMQTQRFDSPDQVALFTTVSEIGITVLAMVVGAVIGIGAAVLLKGRMIRKES